MASNMPIATWQNTGLTAWGTFYETDFIRQRFRIFVRNFLLDPAKPLESYPQSRFASM